LVVKNDRILFASDALATFKLEYFPNYMA
jgi:hypothetical protein